MSFNIISGIFAGAAIVAFASWISQCKPVIGKMPKTISRQNFTPDEILCRPGDKIKLFVENLNGEQITWEYNEVTGIEYTLDDTDSSLTVSVRDDSPIITTEDKVIVKAKSEGKIIDKIDLPVGAIKPLDVPVDNTDIFTFTATNSPNDTITGFSDKVKNDPSILVKNYNSLDFSEQDTVRYIDKDCQFNVDTAVEIDDEHKKIFDLWKPFEINFGNLTFLPNEEGMTGYHLFYKADLNSLITLNFDHSNWAPAETSYSAECVFEGANLSGVINLNLKDTVFASTEMVSGERIDHLEEEPTLWTASGTFLNSDLSNLVTLNLSGVDFAVDEMNISEGELCTAESTFSGCKFDLLEELNLENAVFAAEKMMTSGEDTTIATGAATFWEVGFPKLALLDLTNTKFAAKEMNAKTIETAESTFGFCKFDLLEEFKLGSAVFAEKEMSDSCIRTAYQTFILSEFPKLTSLNLNDTNFAVKEIGGKEIYTALSTFSECKFALLEEFNLENTMFATKEMTISGKVYSGEYTFGGCVFNCLEELNLKNAVFADEGINTEGEIFTGYFTFSSVNFLNLKKLDLRETVLFTVDMDGSAKIASCMFKNTTFPISFHDLYLPEDYEGKNGEWKGTFENDDSVDYSSLMVHGYKTSPDWFVDSNLTNAIWVKNIPITSEFFNLTPSEDDGNLYVVNGFSEDVAAHPEKLEPYNVLDFTDNLKVKFVGETCSFGEWQTLDLNLRNFWEGLYKLSFEGMHFLNDNEERSGYRLFRVYEFVSLVELNLRKTIWADNETKISGSFTFYSSKFPKLKKLNLSSTTFAGDKTYTTADSTFGFIKFTELILLDLSNTVFAVKGMKGDDEIRTGSSTFASCTFTQLKEINLENTIFAAEGMECRYINTGSYTFQFCNFNSLEKLDLKNVVFAAEGMQGNDILIGFGTFYMGNFKTVFTTIILPEYNEELGDWFNTFSRHEKEFVVDVYGYDSCPEWFGDDWWLGAEWHESYLTT